MANDLCVLHRDPSSQPDWLKALPDCSISSPSGPYNIAPFLFWGSFVAFILIVVATVVIYIARSDWKKEVNGKMLREGLPGVRTDIGTLQKQMAKIEPLKLDERLKNIEQYFGGK